MITAETILNVSTLGQIIVLYGLINYTSLLRIFLLSRFYNIMCIDNSSNIVMSLSHTEIQLLYKLKISDLDLNTIKDELESVSNKSEFMLQAYEVRPEVITYIGNQLSKDKNFALGLLNRMSSLSPESTQYFHPFPYLDKHLRDDEQVVTMAVNQDVMLMNYVSERLQSNEAFKAKLLKSNSYFPIIRFSKVLKNTLLEGVSDTFQILLGNHGLATKLTGSEFHPNELKYGVLDILIFPLLAKQLFAFGLPIKPLGYEESVCAYRYSKDHDKAHLYKPLRHVATAIAFGLSCIRLGAAALATLLLVPVIMNVHILKYPYVAYQQYRLLQMEGLLHKGDRDTNPTPITLNDYLERTGSTLNDLYGTNGKELGCLVTSSSKKNTDEERYGSLISRNPKLFFQPSNVSSKHQEQANKAASNLEVMLPYDPNDFYSNPTLRTFY